MKLQIASVLREGLVLRQAVKSSLFRRAWI